MTPWTLVTGASGFLGAALVRALVQRGYRVKGLVRPGSSLEALRGLPADRFALAVGDVTVQQTVFRALAGCDRLFHVAANHCVWAPRADMIRRPAVDGTRAVLDAARRRNVRKTVVTSSAYALGVSESKQPMTETHRFNLKDPETYVRAKYEAERVALQEANRGLPVVIVEPTTMFGPGDHKPTPPGALILHYLRMSPNLRVPVTGGGFNVADVRDVATGHILAMEKGRLGQRYVLGGENLTYQGFFEQLSELTGLAGPGKPQGKGSARLLAAIMFVRARCVGQAPLITHKLARDYSGRYLFFNSSAAKSELGFEARPAVQSLSDTVRWFLTNGLVPDYAARRVKLELRAA